jgi:hypothetical protein
MHRRSMSHHKPLLLVLTLAVMTTFGIFASAAAAELTVDEPFEYDSPGMTFEAQHVGPAHCKGKFQVNPKTFPAEVEPGTGYFIGGGREVVTCRSTNHQPLEGNIPPGHAFPELNPAADYWTSEWFRSFNPGQKCFTITLPLDRVKGKMGLRGFSYHVVAYFEYTRECHAY